MLGRPCSGAGSAGGSSRPRAGQHLSKPQRQEDKLKTLLWKASITTQGPHWEAVRLGGGYHARSLQPARPRVPAQTTESGSTRTWRHRRAAAGRAPWLPPPRSRGAGGRGPQDRTDPDRPSLSKAGRRRSSRMQSKARGTTAPSDSAIQQDTPRRVRRRTQAARGPSTRADARPSA